MGRLHLCMVREVVAQSRVRAISLFDDPRFTGFMTWTFAAYRCLRPQWWHPPYNTRIQKRARKIKKKRVHEQMREKMGAEEMQMRRGLRGRGALSGEQQKAETVGVVTWLEPWTWTRPRGGMRLWKEGTLQKPARCQTISRGIRCREPWKGICWSTMRDVHVSKVEAEEEEVDEGSKIEHKIWEQKNHFFL